MKRYHTASRKALTEQHYGRFDRVDDFVELLVYGVDNFTTHSFIAKNQAQYLKQRKKEITETECIILLDFAVSYHYVVQDEIQGYH